MAEYMHAGVCCEAGWVKCAERDEPVTMNMYGKKLHLLFHRSSEFTFNDAE